MEEHPHDMIQCNPSCEAAVMELYEWLVATYLPRRFPTMYRLIPRSQKTDEHCLYNVAADQHMPLHVTSPLEALRMLGENVDDDFLFLLPSSTGADGSPLYHLEAFLNCFPSGFSTLAKLGKPLATIHEPVPAYGARLERSMDRFFAKMELGKAVRRTNWSVTTNADLYCPVGNHMYADDAKAKSKDESAMKNEKTPDIHSSDLEESIAQQKKDVVIDNCRLRCERQTLHRLPKTKALVFAFKTYQYTLDEVKAEGSGPALAEAIAGLGQGNSPGMAFYKRGVVWGDKVIEYLKS